MENLKVAKGRKPDTVIYISPDGKMVWKGGSLTWRTNNPGAIKSSSWTKRHGAIGQIDNFAAWPEYDMGRQAYSDLVTGPTYGSYYIATALRKLVPPSENDTEKYINDLANMTGLDVNKRKFKSLSSGELSALLNAIQVLEGWKVGTIRPMKKVVAAKKKKGVITQVQPEGGSFITKAEAVRMVQNDELDVSAPGGAYVRDTPDKIISDNLLEIATPEDPR